MKKIINILVALGVILGLTLVAAPVAAQPCVCPATMSSFDIADGLGPPDFCAGMLSDYDLGLVTPFTLTTTLIGGTDSISVDFPAGTDLSSVVFTGVLIDAIVLDNAASLVISGTHLEAKIPASLGILTGDGVTPHSIQVDSVVNPPPGTYCLYVDYKLACCAPVQFACATYTVAPATKVVDFHFDFSPAYAGIAEDYIPAFLAGAAPTAFDLILRDENGGCNDPCTSPSAFWFEVTKCPAGETITFLAPDTVIYSLTNADVVAGTKYSLMAAPFAWPPPDFTWACAIDFSSPGDYEICFYLQCPAGACGAGPTIVADECLSATAYQYMDAFQVELLEKWNLISLPLFPYDTSIENVLGSMEHIDQLVSVWYFGQCEDPAPNLGIWHSEAYNVTASTFIGDVDDIVAGKAYWVRTLHPGETGYVSYASNGFWVFGTHAIMPASTGMDMGYFDVCEGWNMVGFKAPWPLGVVSPQNDAVYLWNFNTGVMDTVHYGMIYEWDPTILPGNWITYLPGAAPLNPGLGYWIPFDGDGEIYPSA